MAGSNRLIYEEIAYRPKYKLREMHYERLAYVDYIGDYVERPEFKISIRRLEVQKRPVQLILSPGYAWDGPSGPTIDTETTMRASCVHDALYWLISAGVLPRAVRPQADKEFLRILREDGMSFLRRRAWYYAVRKYGASHVQIAMDD